MGSKVHAQVEADRKLFTAVTIEKRETLDEAVRVLSLLNRENMRARAIDDLWQAWHVDSQVRAALEQTLQDDAFATLVRKRLPQLALGDIRKSLRRASIAVNYPNIFRDIPSAPDCAAISAPPSPEPIRMTSETLNPEPVAPSGGDNGGQASVIRHRLQSTRDLIDLGRLQIGVTLTIRGRDNSSARVLDGRYVEFQGVRMTFNEWGQRVTGWSAIQIYAWACLPDGRTLAQLRDQPSTDGPKD
jgi:hypothetical protein